MLSSGTMDPSVKKALQNLAGIYEEGFMTDSEYDKRRKSIIDGATAVGSRRLGPPGQHRPADLC